MKLKFENIDVERSGAFKAEKFGIGNSRVIMEILRGKMYSNPIQTICQEIMSNARDAHREVGKEHVPIEVKLPNKLEPTFWIRDFGPGITPDRMANVFILYGVSTKRSDNIQTGGFGLGAKSPFSYSDTFSVVSITTENGKKIRRQYIAHLDETGVGEMSCVQEHETDEPQGTTISITPKPQDYMSFKYYTMRAGVFWDVRPKILGDGEWEWPPAPAFHKGSDWTIYDTNKTTYNPGYTTNYYHRQTYSAYQRNSTIQQFNYTVPCVTDPFPYALIDGIPYKINLDHLFPGTQQGRIFNNIPLRLHFDVGELSVTANREEIDYQADVIAHMRNRLNRALNELREMLSAKLKQIDDLKEAIFYWRKLKSQQYGNLLDAYTWQGIDLKKFDRMRVDSQDGIRVAAYQADGSTRHGCRKTQSYYASQLSISENTILAENDTDDKGISRARLATLFDKPNTKYVVVLDFSKKIVKEKNDAGEEFEKLVQAEDKLIEKRKKIADEKYHWKSLKPTKLSAVAKKVLPKEQKPKGPKKPRSKIIKVKRFDLEKGGFAPALMDKVPEKETKFYVEVSGNKVWLNKATNQTITMSRLGDLYTAAHKAELDIEFYGVVPSHAKKLNATWKPLLGYLEGYLASLKEKVPDQFGNQHSAKHRLRGNTWDFINKKAFLDRINPKGPLYRYIVASKQIETAAAKVQVYNYIAGALRKPRIYSNYRVGPKKGTTQLEQLYAEFMSAYPLVAPTLGTLQLTNNSILDDVIQYVNMKDKDLA